MQPVEEQALGDYLDELIKATKAKTAAWEKLNPTTYAWRNGPLRILLQQVVMNVHVAPLSQLQKAMADRLAPNPVYVFTAENLGDTPSRVELSANSAESLALHAKLESLFAEASRTSSERGISFLQSYAPPPAGGLMNEGK